jgi:hypothetical protein
LIDIDFPPLLNEVDPRVRSNRWLDIALTFFKSILRGMQQRDQFIEFLRRKGRAKLCSDGLQGTKEFGQFVSETVGHWIVRQNPSQGRQRMTITPSIEQTCHFMIEI